MSVSRSTRALVFIHGNVLSQALAAELLKMAARATMAVEIHLRDSDRDRLTIPLEPPAAKEFRNFQTYEAPGRARHKKGKR
jgi:hypothetical protein